LLITRATEYAIRAVLYLAKQPTGEIVLKKDICRTQDITPAFLTKILQPLIKAGIVGSQRGVGGGFYLARTPDRITLLDVVEAQEGPVYLNQCLMNERACDRDVFCPAHGAWRHIRGEMTRVLAEYTFARLAEMEEKNLEQLTEAPTRST
jgi:Rrf2 family protein